MYCKPSLSSEIFKRARKIKAVILDVDGVLTDGKIVYDNNHLETKQFNAQDGLGIKLAGVGELITGIISARNSDAIRHRANELGIEHLYLGRYDKINAYDDLILGLGLTDEAVCFVGDDLPDIPVLERVGLPVAVANATLAVKEAARLETTRPGGQGAIRDTIEFILYAQGRLQTVMDLLKTRNSGETGG